MTFSGKLRSWPKGANFSNLFCQIYLKFDDELILFNGYMSDDNISNLNILLAPHWGDIQVTQMKPRDPRKMAQMEMDVWAKDRSITIFKMAQMFLLQLKIELITLNEKNNKSLDLNDLNEEI